MMRSYRDPFSAILLRPWDRIQFVAALLPCGFVACSVEYRCAYTPARAPRPKAKWRPANCILSHGLSSMSFQNGLAIALVEIDGVPDFGKLQILLPSEKSNFPRSFNLPFDWLGHGFARNEGLVQNAAVQRLRRIHAQNPQ